MKYNFSKGLAKYFFAIIVALIYSEPAYALIPEIIEQVRSDINQWVLLTAVGALLVGGVYKPYRTAIFSVLLACAATYMTWTIVRLVIETDIYD